MQEVSAALVRTCRMRLLKPALLSASRGAGVSAVSPARVALSEGQARRGAQLYSGAGVEPVASERQRPRRGSGEGRAGVSAEPDAWHLRRGRRSSWRCHRSYATEMAQQEVSQVYKHGSVV